MSFGSRSLAPANAYERKRWAVIKDFNQCLNCEGPHVEIHHLLVGGLRVSHLATVGLCAWCHRGAKEAGETITSMRWLCGPSLFHHKREFYERWTSDQYLLDKQNDEIGYPPWPIPSRSPRRKSRCTAAANQMRRDGTPGA